MDFGLKYNIYPLIHSEGRITVRVCIKVRSMAQFIIIIAILGKKVSAKALTS